MIIVVAINWINDNQVHITYNGIDYIISLEAINITRSYSGEIDDSTLADATQCNTEGIND